MKPTTRTISSTWRVGSSLRISCAMRSLSGATSLPYCVCSVRIASATVASRPSSDSAASNARCMRFWPYTRSKPADSASARTRAASAGSSCAQICSRYVSFTLRTASRRSMARVAKRRAASWSPDWIDCRYFDSFPARKSLRALRAASSCSSYSSMMGCSLAKVSLESPASSSTKNRFTPSPLIVERGRVFSRARNRSKAGHFCIWPSESDACMPSTNDLRMRDFVSCHLLKSVTISPSDARIWSKAPLDFSSLRTSSPIFSIWSRKNAWRSSGVSSPPFSAAICSICSRAFCMVPRQRSCISGPIIGAIICCPRDCICAIMSSRAGSNASS